VDRLTLDAELREAIDKRQFNLAYQPIVSLITGHLQGFEALLRWNHPDRGAMPPSAFIPRAEATGLIVPLGQWVLQEACRQARAWRQILPDAQDLTISVNLSVRQLQDPSILDVVAAALTDTGLPAGQLQLEITESVVGRRGQVVAILDRLHATGVRLAIDDFGTGYSSLSRLHALPIDVVKIDKSFIDALAGGGPAPMVAATISMAHSRGLQTVAEGVETTDQLPFLRLHGCDNVQGYLFGRPLPADAVTALLRQRGTRGLWANPIARGCLVDAATR
jgi:EAL domain-containing protein (putative c-di-GMP-specific phosphodiesterase class I)